MVDNNDLKVGVIGLGSMGSALADALLGQECNLSSMEPYISKV